MDIFWVISEQENILSKLASDQTLLFAVQVIALLIALVGCILAVLQVKASSFFKFIVITASVAVVFFLASTAVVISRGRDVRLDRKDLYDFTSEVFGVARDQFKRTIVIDSLGCATIMLNMTIRAIGYDVGQLEQTYSVPHHGADTTIRMDTVIMCSNGSSLLLKSKLCTEEDVCQVLVFSPPIMKGDSAALMRSLVWKSRGKPGSRPFSLSKEQYERDGIQHESCGMKISYPCDTVVINVVFPRDYKPTNPSFDVWYHKQEVRNVPEYSRLSTGPSPIEFGTYGQEPL